MRLARGGPENGWRWRGTDGNSLRPVPDGVNKERQNRREWYEGTRTERGGGPDVFVFVFWLGALQGTTKRFKVQMWEERRGIVVPFLGSQVLSSCKLCAPACALCSVCTYLKVLLYSIKLCPSLYAGPTVNSVRQAPCREPNTGPSGVSDHHPWMKSPSCPVGSAVLPLIISPAVASLGSW